MKDIYGDKVTKDVWLYLNIDKQYGWSWKITAHYLENDHPVNIRDDDPLSDFAIKGWFRDRDNLLKYPENKADLVMRGDNHGYLNAYFVNGRRAAKMASTLKQIRKSLDKQYAKYGNGADFIDDVMKVAVAIKAKGFFVQTKSGGWDWQSGEYRFMNPSEARRHMEKIHREYLESVVGVEQAA